MPIIPPILPLPDDPTDNEETLWQMIMALRRALYGEGGALGGAGSFFSCYDCSLPRSQSGLDVPGNSIPTVLGAQRTDEFTRTADTDFLPLATSGDRTKKWVVVEGSNTVFQIRNSALDTDRRLSVYDSDNSSNSTRGFAYWDKTWADDQESGLSFVTGTGGFGGQRDIAAVRIDRKGGPTTATCYTVSFDHTSSTWELYKNVKGTRSSISTTAVQAVAVDAWIKIRAVGTTISAIYETAAGVETTVLSVTDSSISCGAAGICVGNTWIISASDFTSFHKWKGTDLGEVANKDCFDNTEPDCNTDFFPGQLLMVGLCGNIAIACSNFLVADPERKRLGINTCTPDGTLDVYDGGVPNTLIFSASKTTTYINPVSGSVVIGRGTPAFNTAFTLHMAGNLAQDAITPVFTGRGCAGSVNTPTAIQQNSTLVTFSGRAFGATAYSGDRGAFSVKANQNWTDAAQGTYLSLETTQNGGTTQLEKFRIGNAGELGIGGATFGTLGYVLASGGTGAPPTWSVLSTLPTGLTAGSVIFVGATGLLAQDNANLFWEDTQNVLIVGGSGPHFSGTTFEVRGTGSASPRGAAFVQVSNDTGAFQVNQGKSRGTFATPLAVVSGDTLGAWHNWGYDSAAAWGIGASVVALTAEAWTGTAHGTTLDFRTVAIGATALTTRFLIGPSGQWGIGGATYGTSGQAFLSGGAAAAPTWGNVMTNPMTTLGDIVYEDATPAPARLAGNITTTRKFLRQTGNGAISAAPAWDTIIAADVPGSALTKTDDTNVTLTLGGSPTTALLAAASLTLGWTGTLAVARGGTGQSTVAGYNALLDHGALLGLADNDHTQYLLLAGGTMTGNLLFTDNSYDIGASGATRPRDLFLAGEVHVASAGPHAFGTSPALTSRFLIEGDFTGSTSVRGLRVGGTLTPGTASNAYGAEWGVDFGTFTSGVSALFASFRITGAGITQNGTGTVTDAASLSIEGAPGGAAAVNKYAILVTNGVSRFNGNVQFGTDGTGAGAALLGANSPAATLTAPYTWITAKSSDGSTVYVPAWK